MLKDIVLNWKPPAALYHGKNVTDMLGDLDSYTKVVIRKDVHKF